MIDENGVDVGRTWRDVLSEIDNAVVYLLGSTTAKVEGDDWKAYKVGVGLIRIDIQVPAK